MLEKLVRKKLEHGTEEARRRADRYHLAFRDVINALLASVATRTRTLAQVLFAQPDQHAHIASESDLCLPLAQQPGCFSCYYNHLHG